MDLGEEWKSLCPISFVFSPPLLLSDDGDGNSPNARQIGPLFFNPSTQKPTQIIFTNCSPSIHSPFPRQSLSRSLETSKNSILPSTSASIAASFGPEISNTPLLTHNNNPLQFLRCPGSGRFFVFYPTGQNFDQVGFLLLSIEGGQVVVKQSGAADALNNRIIKMVVQKVVNISGDSSWYSVVGYLMICTMYSVYWYSVKVSGDSPLLVLLGSKLFKTCGVVHACWSPLIEEECLVLLESGDLFLFDLESCSGRKGLKANFKGKNLRVAWDDLSEMEKGSWVSCDFSWHPRILVVAHSSVVYLVDLSQERCKVSCLLRINMSMDGSTVDDDRFVAFSRAGSDGFNFVVASEYFLFLCDVRKLLTPVLRWVHGIDDPTYITIVKLSKLRSNSKNDEYNWASENGHCILIGSFWNDEFSLICYGPDTRTSVASEISRFCKSIYAWKLPCELSLAARDCYCGSCLIREEFTKDLLPEWINWQEKKDIVLGFFILDEDLSVQLFEPEDFGGFTLIRLMSSGNLELQRYFASPTAVNFSEKAHKQFSILLEESLVYQTEDEIYNLPQQFQHLKPDYLYGHLNDNLDEVLNNKKRKLSDSDREVPANPDFHLDICKKLKACGISKFRPLDDINDVVRDIVSPMSISEISIMRMWSSLPTVLLRMSFVSYSELSNILVNKKYLSLKFLDVPHQPQLPPFSFRNPSHLSNKWPGMLQDSNALVGPVAPLHFLVTFNKLYIEGKEDGQSANREVELQCSKVMQTVNKFKAPNSAENLDNENERAVSLANDKDDMCYGSQDKVNVSLYEPVALLITNNADPSSSSTYENRNYSTFVSRTNPTEVFSSDRSGFIKPEAIDAICPTGLKFSNRTIDHLPTEFKYFIGQQKKFQDRFSVERSSFQKQNL